MAEWAAELVKQIFGFLRSKVFMVIILLTALYLGFVNIDQLKELVQAVKELFE